MIEQEKHRKWNKFFKEHQKKGFSWSQIRYGLAKKGYKAIDIELLIKKYKKDKLKQSQVAVAVLASMFLLILMSAFFIAKPSITGMAVGGPGDIYYVDATNGDDSNDGLSPETAIKAIAKVNSLPLDPGDAVLFKRGEIWREAWLYSGPSGTSTNPITFGAYGTGNKPKFYGSINASSTSYWTNLGNNLWTTPANFQVQTYMIFYNTSGYVRMGARRTSSATLTANWDFWWNSATKSIEVYHTSNPGSVGNGIELPEYDAYYQTLIWFEGEEYIIFRDIEISYTRYRGLGDHLGNHNEFRNLDFKYGYEKAIWIEGDNVIADNNSFYLCGIRGQPVPYGLDAQGENMWVTQINNPTITNNKIERCGGVCLNLFHTNGGEIRGNKIWNCQQSPTDWSAAIYYDGCSNSVTSYNNVTDCQVGLQVGSEIAGWDSTNISFHHNIISGSAISDMLVNTNLATISSYNINISHNTFYKNDYVSGSGFGYQIFLKYFFNLNFKNNIIYNNYPSTTAGYLMLHHNGSISSGFISDYNAWNSTSGRNKWSMQSEEYAGLAAWQTGQEQDTHSITSDPFFVDAANDDFTPQSGSPACSMSSTGSYVGAIPCEGGGPPAPFCGDSTCNGDEDCSTCETDCGVCPPPEPFCGDATCNGEENCTTCEADCGTCPPPEPFCGDSTCNGNEDCNTCEADCGTCPTPEPFCGDATCNGEENCTTCEADCGTCPPPEPFCGDSTCNGNEDCNTCEADCGTCPPPEPTCGDETCDQDENCTTCETDCGTCPTPEPFCGDSTCNGNEDCTNCPADCDACPAPPSSGGGSGGSSGGGGGGSVPSDETNWNCEEWSECINGRQTQKCTHKNGNVIKTNNQKCEIVENTKEEEISNEINNTEEIITESKGAPEQQTPKKEDKTNSKTVPKKGAKDEEISGSGNIIREIKEPGVIESETKPVPYYLLIPGIIAAIVAILFIIGISTNDRPKPVAQTSSDTSVSSASSNTKDESNEIDNSNEVWLNKLYNYVKDAKNYGLNQEEVRNKLQKTAFKPEIIEKVINTYYQESILGEEKVDESNPNASYLGLNESSETITDMLIRQHTSDLANLIKNASEIQPLTNTKTTASVDKIDIKDENKNNIIINRDNTDNSTSNNLY